MKRCSTCKITKSVAEFNKDKAQRDGYKNYCRVCDSARKQAWRKANPEKDKAKDIKKRKAKPDKYKAYIHKRRARLKGNGGAYTEAQWLSLKEKYNHTCLACGKQEPEIKLTVDHILPISKGGSNNIENIQPLCGSCNSSKNATFVDYRKLYEKDR